MLTENHNKIKSLKLLKDINVFRHRGKPCVARARSCNENESGANYYFNSNVIIAV